MLLSILLFVAVFLTLAMFLSKSMMLGFPCLIFWAIAGSQGYLCSTVMWDIYYLIFFGCMGMTIFSGFAMYGLRERRDTIGDKSMESGDGNFIDETSSSNTKEDMPDIEPDNESYIDEPRSKPSKRTQALRRRAEERKSGEIRSKKRTTNFIEITK